MADSALRGTSRISRVASFMCALAPDSPEARRARVRLRPRLLSAAGERSGSHAPRWELREWEWERDRGLLRAGDPEVKIDGASSTVVGAAREWLVAIALGVRGLHGAHGAAVAANKGSARLGGAAGHGPATYACGNGGGTAGRAAGH
eukprot:12863894-Alexandrium_andersonii.AAC.1